MLRHFEQERKRYKITNTERQFSLSCEIFWKQQRYNQSIL